MSKSEEVFIPKNIGMTKKDIWSVFYSRQREVPGKYRNMVYVSRAKNLEEYDAALEAPLFLANDIPSDIAQEFVDRTQEVREERYGEKELDDAYDKVRSEMFEMICKRLNITHR